MRNETFTVDESWLRRESHEGRLAVQPLAEELVTRERQLIEAALAGSEGRVSGPSGAAAKLGIPGSTLESKIKALGIRKDGSKAPDDGDAGGVAASPPARANELAPPDGGV